MPLSNKNKNRFFKCFDYMILFEPFEIENFLNVMTKTETNRLL